MRRTGSSPQYNNNMGAVYELVPHCYAMACQLSAEKSPEDTPKAFLSVITKERDCDKFQPWQVGVSPKELKEMLHAQQLREWQEKVRREEMDWREQQRKEDDARHEQWRKEDLEWKLREERESRRQFRWNLIVMGLIVTLFMAAVQVLGSLIQSGVWPHRQPESSSTQQAPAIQP